MNDHIAYCGLNCETCDARIATITHDDALREKIAKLWSELNGVPIAATEINCMGCRAEGVKTVYCSQICPIRKCAREKKNPTCGSCPEMDSCPKVNAILQNNPEARDNLKTR